MYTVVPKSRVTLDARLLCQDIIVLMFKVADNLGETVGIISVQRAVQEWVKDSYLASLSIWSPKPGVSTMVREMRVPSSSNSSSR